MESEREPIVHAVLADPVVKAVLADPSSTTAVVAAINEGTEGVVSNPPPPPPTEHPTSPITTVESGTTTKKTITGTTITQEGRMVATPTSTEEEERVSAGQRSVNMIWETTQRQIALGVVAMALMIAAWLAVSGESDNGTAASVFLYGVANLVIGFYFGRTNHQKIGGVEQGR